MQAGSYADAQAADIQRSGEWFQKRRATRTQTAAVEPRVTAEPRINALDKEEEISQTQINLSDLVSRIPAEVKAGAWFEIYRGESKVKHGLNLSALLKNIGRLLFADRTSRSVLEVELDGFLQDLNSGRTVLINDGNRLH